jgi:ADP-heptose:LPS heptosyltransferase
LTSKLPSALGHGGPPFRIVVTLPPGPRRVTDDADQPRYYVPEGPNARPRRAQRVNIAACRNILVVKLDFIGDHVLTTPFLANLRLNAPRATITLVVLDRAYAFAVGSRFVDRVVTVSSAEGRRIVFGASNLSVLASFRRDYVGGAFDMALVPRWDIDFNGALQVAVGSRARRIAGFTETSTPRKALLNRGEDRFYTDLVFDRRSVHEVEHKLALIKALGGRIASRSLALDISPSAREEGHAFLDQSFGADRRPVLAVAPFVGDPRRQFPVERLSGLVRRLAEALDLMVVVVGGPADAARGEAFAEEVGPRATSSLGRVGAVPSAALLEKCVAFVGMDSGPAHLAAAAGTPTAVISRHPRDGDPDDALSPVRFAPWGEPGKVLVIQPDRQDDPPTDHQISAALEGFIRRSI